MATSAAVRLEGLEQSLGYRFEQPELLQLALTHRSYSAHHNERLEFLGDSVLGLGVADLLYRKMDDGSEGDLSRLRAQLVREETLHRLALDLHVPQYLMLGAGELHSGGRVRPSILADAMEAILGAIYLDGGYDATRSVIQRLFKQIEISQATSVAAKDAKTALQEWTQARRLALPVYEVARVLGAAHDQTFEVRCILEALDMQASAQGRTRRKAEQAAAQMVLSQLNNTL